jgi:transcriptional regulator with XRE-family HTH domain
MCEKGWTQSIRTQEGLQMGRRGDPEDWRLFVILLRSFKHWQAKQLAEESGVAVNMISLYETAKEVPSPETVQRLIDAVGFPAAWVEPVITLLRTLRLGIGSGAARDVEDGTDLTAGLEPLLIDSIRLALAPACLELSALLRREAPATPATD